jgi:competence protein ComEC
LSFAATMGIVYFMPSLEKLTANWGEWLGVKSILLVTMSAITATLPFLVYNFGVLSLISPVVNILVLPLVPLTMLLGFLSAAPLVGPGFAYVCNFLLIYILKTIHFFGNLPYGHLPMQVPQWFFACMIAGVFLLYQIIRNLAENTPVDETFGK